MIRFNWIKLLFPVILIIECCMKKNKVATNKMYRSESIDIYMHSDYEYHYINKKDNNQSILDGYWINFS